MVLSLGAEGHESDDGVGYDAEEELSGRRKK